MRTGQVIILVVLTAVVAVLSTLAVVHHSPEGMQAPPNREAMVHEMGGQVMPFSLDSTTHVFEMTTTGGVQQVVAKDPADSAQILLIRQHLMHEALQFQKGDFSDPMALHGKDMPGLKELSAGADQVHVEFAALPDGGQITFTTSDLSLLTAIHRWFGAQLSDHGADATYR
jgi:hypothetical protein